MRRFLAVLAAATMLLGLAASPVAAHELDCVKIRTTGFGEAAPPQPGDPPNLARTVATIESGPLKGTTAAAFELTGATPPVLPFVGVLTFTTAEDEEEDDASTLTVDLQGTLDVTTGAFEASGPVSAGTGEFAGATGFLVFEGVQNLVDGTFTETVAGKVCVPDDGDDDEDDQGQDNDEQ